MSATETAPVATTEAPKARKVAKAKPKATKQQDLGGFTQAVINKWIGKDCNVRKDGHLTKKQVATLKFLSKQGKPVTVERIATALDTAKWPKLIRWALGKIEDDGRCPFSLLGRGLVKQTPVDVDGKADHLYSITKSGEAALRLAEKK